MRLLDLSAYWGVIKVEKGKKSDQEAVDAVKVQRRGQAKVGVIGQRGCLGATQSREPTNDSTDFGLATSSAPDTKSTVRRCCKSKTNEGTSCFATAFARKKGKRPPKTVGWREWVREGF